MTTAESDLIPIALDPASPWPKMRGDARQQGRSPVSAVDPGTEPWRVATGKGIFSTPVIDAAGTVYIGSADQRFRAIAADGTVRWELETGEIIDSAALLDDEGRVIFGSGDGVLYALDRTSGSVRWTFTAAPAAETGGFISWFEGNLALAGGDLLVVPNDNFRIYGIDRRTGEQVWEHVTFDQTWACPAVDPDTGTIYAATNFPFLPNVHALDPADGTARWSAQTRGSMVASPLLTDDGQVVVGGFDGLVRSYDAATGEPRWVAETRDHVYASPALGLDGTVVQPGCDGTIYGFDPATGAVRWTFEVGAPVRASAAVDADGHLYVGTGDGRLLVLGPDGSLRWQAQLVTGPRNDLNGSPALGPFGVVLAGESGEVLFVPYEHGLRPEVARARTTLAAGAPADGARLVVAERFGSVREGSPEAVDADDPLTVVLRVTEAGRSVLAHLDSTGVEVEVDPPVPVDVDVSGDRTFVVIAPRAPWVPPEGGEVRVRLRAPYLVDPERDGLVFTGGRPGGVAERELVLPVRPRPSEPVGLAAGYELHRVAAPLPTILPSYNQIGFDSIHYLLGIVRRDSDSDGDVDRALAWAVGGRLDPTTGGAVVDPSAGTRFPLEVRIDGDLVTFVNDRGFTIEFNGFPLPFESFRVAARVAVDGSGTPTTSPSIVARADSNAIDFYGPFLQQLGYCNPDTGLLVVSGAAELRTHEPGGTPVGVTAELAMVDGALVAEVGGTPVTAADHNVGLLAVDADGHPLPLAYATATTVETGDDGVVTGVSVPVPDDGSRPVQAYLMVDTSVAAVGRVGAADG
ncbi:MAG: PQQ-binding-like beta-propeller repeat protein [Acidimicrobiales bacterium]